MVATVKGLEVKIGRCERFLDGPLGQCSSFELVI